jgi:DNA-binding HxlR family transcriptional regulator
MPPKNRSKRVFSCPVEAAQEVIGGKWKPIILWHLYTADRPWRFGVLRRAIPNATEKMIIQQLRELEAAGVVKRRVFREVPPRVEYSLTGDGKELKTALEAICAWGEKYMKRIGATALRSAHRVTHDKSKLWGNSVGSRKPETRI